MRSINLHEAKTHLSRLVEKAAGGAPFIIAKAGRPLVKVVPLEPAERQPPGRFDFLTGEIVVPDDFDRMGVRDVAGLFDERR